MLSRAASPAARLVAAAPRSALASPSSSRNYATLKDIETRLKSIRNINKITKTMSVVASTKLTRAQRSMVASRFSGQTSNTVFENAETKALESEDQKKELYVVCSSDKGLCGGINSGLSRFVRRTFAQMPNEGANIDIVVLGEKCKSQLSRSNPQNIVMSFAGFGKDVPTLADAQAVADQIVLLNKDYSSIKILYNKFINATSYEPTIVETFSEEAIRESPQFAQFEVDEAILGNLREYALANSLYWALAEGHAAEQAARKSAMENASKNAGEMIEKFQILYNRGRQAAITNELVEIITGATASAEQ